MTWRFIAGAVCANCGQMDTVRMNLEDKSIECVECGDTQIAPQTNQPDESEQQTLTWS